MFGQNSHLNLITIIKNTIYNIVCRLTTFRHVWLWNDVSKTNDAHTLTQKVFAHRFPFLFHPSFTHKFFLVTRIFPCSSISQIQPQPKIKIKIYLSFSLFVLSVVFSWFPWKSEKPELKTFYAVCLRLGCGWLKIDFSVVDIYCVQFRTFTWITYKMRIKIKIC